MYDIDEWMKNAKFLHREFYGKSDISVNYEIEFTEDVALRKKIFLQTKSSAVILN